MRDSWKGGMRPPLRRERSHFPPVQVRGLMAVFNAPFFGAELVGSLRRRATGCGSGRRRRGWGERPFFHPIFFAYKVSNSGKHVWEKCGGSGRKTDGKKAGKKKDATTPVYLSASPFFFPYFPRYRRLRSTPPDTAVRNFSDHIRYGAGRGGGG